MHFVYNKKSKLSENLSAMYCFFFNLFRVLEIHNKHQNKFRHKNLYSFTFSNKNLKNRANLLFCPYVLVCTRVLLVCCSYVLVCTRMLPVCYLYVLVCTCMYLYVTRMYSYVLVWCFSHDHMFGSSLQSSKVHFRIHKPVCKQRL